MFVAGLWLPRTHAEAPAEISALLSGVVVTGGVVPLLRLAATDAVLLSAIRWVGMASAVLGVVYALNARDAKRLLAWSTLSQMGLVVLSPLSGGAMALGHGLGNLWATGVLAPAETGNAAFRPDLPLRARFGDSIGSFSAVFG